MKRLILVNVLLAILLFIICYLIVAPTQVEAQLVKVTPETYKTIEDINLKWNKKITYQKDIDHYGKNDVWAYPKDNKGDCEDYAIAKKKDLDIAGILNYFVICELKNKKYHAVLVVYTSIGTLMLDNSTDKIYLMSMRKKYKPLFVQADEGWVCYNTGKTTRSPKAYKEWKNGKR